MVVVMQIELCVIDVHVPTNGLENKLQYSLCKGPILIPFILDFQFPFHLTFQGHDLLNYQIRESSNNKNT